MGKMLAEFPDLPWEMRMELAHQMWDEARHIEIVAKAVEEELGGELGYGPWTLVWWWMQNDPDPLRRITVTNSWAEANLMHTLAQWRKEAEKRGFTRIAELADYLQADERTHVRLATDWIQKLTEDEPEPARRAGRLGPQGDRPHPGLPRLALQADARPQRGALHLPQTRRPRRGRRAEPDHRRVTEVANHGRDERGTAN